MRDVTVLMNEELEQALLGALLIDGSALAQVRGRVAGGDLFLLRHQMIYEAMISLMDDGLAVDYTTVMERLRQRRQMEAVGAGYVTSLINSTPTAAHVMTYAEGVHRLALRRRLIAAADAIADAALNTTEMDTDTLLAHVEAKLAAVTGDGTSEHEHPLYAAIGQYMDAIEAAQGKTGVVSGLPTGYAHLDDLIDGVLPGALILIAGRPAMGKSALLVNLMARMAMMGTKCYLWTGEMPAAQIAERLLAMQTTINTQRLRRGLRPLGITYHEWGSVVQAGGKLGQMNIWINDRSSEHVERLIAKALSLHEREKARDGMGLGVVFIDYLQLLRAAGRRMENRNAELETISRMLKSDLASIVPVIAAAQLNRAVEGRADKRPTMSDLRDSGALEQDADVVGLLYRDVVYNEMTDFPNRADLIIAKNRHGRTGTITFHFDTPTLRFTEATTHTVTGGRDDDRDHT